jgi:tetratricopeptide (TPR) repeat protein
MIFQGSIQAPLIERLRELGPGDNPKVAPVVRVLLECWVDPDRQLARLEALADDPDRVVARIALLWLSHAYENLGDLEPARATALRALDLCDDADGPWMRGVLSAHIGGLAFQAGQLDDARHYALAALPILRALGAVEDYAQTRGILAMLALHEGRLDESERMFEELAAEEGTLTLFGGAMELLCGRAELLLARGHVDAGLAAYTQAVDLMRVRGGSGGPMAAFAPWVLFAESARLAATVKHGRRGGGERVELAGIVRELLARNGFVDVPVLGCALFALAVWEITFGDRATGAVLVAYADGYAYNRMLPSFDWSWATSLAQPAEIGPGDPTGLRGQLRAVLERLS